MQILVDGDACPVKSQIVSIAKEFSLKVCIVFSTSHFGSAMEYPEMEKIMVDNESQAADMVIINKVTPGDIVVTGDFGLASLVLGKKATAISFSGRVYDEDNIDKLLFERYLSAEIRRSGGKLKGPAKRSKEDDYNFKEALKLLILKKMKDI
ncbi:MAG: YaiI/YqxD family protein [Bacillota bacterium]